MSIDLPTVLDRLRAIQPELNRRFGVSAIFVFGSHARGEAGPDSDVDLLVDFNPDAKLTLFSLAKLDLALESALGAKVDVVPRASLNPRVAPYIQAELVPA
jgi:hypothetical protein